MEKKTASFRLKQGKWGKGIQEGHGEKEGEEYSRNWLEKRVKLGKGDKARQVEMNGNEYSHIWLETSKVEKREHIRERGKRKKMSTAIFGLTQVK